MEESRYARYASFPIQIPAGELYDGDVVQDAHGRCLTVLEAWHGDAGVIARCLRGAYRLSDAGTAGFGYTGRVHEYQPRSTTLRLTGTLEMDEPLRLGHLPGQRLESTPVLARWAPHVTPGDMLIAADGYPYRIDDDGDLAPPWAWSGPAMFTGQPIATYLERAPVSQSGFVVVTAPEDRRTK